MKKVTVILALVLASVALVACGGGDDDSNTTTGTSTNGAESTGAGNLSNQEAREGGADAILEFETAPSGQLAYTAKYLSATPGKITIELKNPQSLPHDVRIESEGKDLGGTETIAESSTSAPINLKPGSYTFFCSVPGHREAGMEGTLTVIRG
jgi:plastocyanin